MLSRITTTLTRSTLRTSTLARSLSSAPPPPGYGQPGGPPLPTLTPEICKGISHSTLFLIKHGIPHQTLKALSAKAPVDVKELDVGSLVMRWQRMMETMFAAQVRTHHCIIIMGLAFWVIFFIWFAAGVTSTHSDILF